MTSLFGCNLCNKLTLTKCSKCGKVAYCSTECYDKDYEKHLELCQSSAPKGCIDQLFESNPLTDYQKNFPKIWEKIVEELNRQTNSNLLLIIDPDDDEGYYFTEFKAIESCASKESIESIKKEHENKKQNLFSLIVIKPDKSFYYTILGINK